ncbi:TPA: hypothetical protein ACT9A3_002942 [Legionella pneumophila]|uniref:hypothetical protein n=1 Tax=Legionella pneumophila TaxID=446 RepID=UPI0007708588|nr:hypothetical protein [Legionella pneumophila]MDF1930766.1 hypothetical protein [Legionella pneumophila]CZJ16697.1 Uncharacterised protein [Legionella pneumophila]CZJ25831.1 Uncharacterised protein [Legionella pneumophila]CZJ26513.1 Uncharacterised protein [Legionella pneumophila]CZJ29742.1 Uncharacterised protein [Legionella pneumophila]
MDYAELIDDIFEGLNQASLEGAAQIFFTEETKNRILEVEKKIKLTKPLMKDDDLFGSQFEEIDYLM